MRSFAVFTGSDLFRGDKALVEYSKKFDGAVDDILEVTKEEIEEVLNEVDSELIEILKQAKENSIRRLSTVEAAVRLVNETRKPVFEELMRQHMQIIQNIIVNTPIYELSCNISKEAVDLVKETLFQE